MKNLTVFLVTLLGLCGCGPLQTREYEMSEADVRSKLLDTEFEKGLLPGWSSHRPIVHTSSEGGLEWVITTRDDLSHATGIYCPIKIEPAGGDGKKVRVINQCVGITAGKDNTNLDELVDATLTEREPKIG